MWSRGAGAYNGEVTATRTTQPAQSASGDIFLEALTAQDFPALGLALEPDAVMVGLLPGGLRDWRGPDAICAAFEGWFGDVDTFEVVDATVGHIGPRLRLTWRLRVCDTGTGRRPMVVEQLAYADNGASGRIKRISLLCSGYLREHEHD